jgi:hypothetical protein
MGGAIYLILAGLWGTSHEECTALMAAVVVTEQGLVFFSDLCKLTDVSFGVEEGPGVEEQEILTL